MHTSSSSACCCMIARRDLCNCDGGLLGTALRSATFNSPADALTIAIF